MKKFLALIVAAACALTTAAFVACGDEETDSDSSPVTSGSSNSTSSSASDSTGGGDGGEQSVLTEEQWTAALDTDTFLNCKVTFTGGTLYYDFVKTDGVITGNRVLVYSEGWAIYNVYTTTYIASVGLDSSIASGYDDDYCRYTTDGAAAGYTFSAANGDGDLMPWIIDGVEFDYSSLSYNEENNTYSLIAAIQGNNYGFVITVENGKLSTMDYYDVEFTSSFMSVSIEYGAGDIELPQSVTDKIAEMAS